MSKEYAKRYNNISDDMLIDMNAYYLITKTDLTELD